VILSSTVADEEPSIIATPNVRMAAQRRSAGALADSPLVSPAYVSGDDDEGAPAPPTEFRLPTSLIDEIKVSRASASAGKTAIDTTVLEFPNSPFQGTSSSTVPASSVASLTLRNSDDGEEVAVANLTLAPIVLTMVIPATKAAALKLEMEAANCTLGLSTNSTNSTGTSDSNCSVLPQCYYYDEDLQDWSTFGCVATGVSADYRSVTCECTHLTSFMGHIGKSFEAQGERIKTTLNAVNGLSFDSVKQNMVIVSTLGTLWLIYILVAIHTCISGRASQNKMDAMLLNRFSRHRSEAEKRHHQLDDEMEDNLFMKTHPSEREKVAEKALSPGVRGRNRSCCGRVRELVGFKYSQYGLSYRSMLAENHPILSIYYAPNRLDRLTMFMCLLIGQMLIDTLVWDGSMDAKMPDPYSDAKLLLKNATANVELGLVNATNVEAIQYAMSKIDWGMFFAEVVLGFVVELILLPVTFIVMKNLHSAEQARRRDAVWRSLKYEHRLKWLFTSADCVTALRRMRRELKKEEKKNAKEAENSASQRRNLPKPPKNKAVGARLSVLTRTVFNIIDEEPPLQTQVTDVERLQITYFEEEQFAKEDAKRRKKKGLIANYIDSVIHSAHIFCSGIVFLCALIWYALTCGKKKKTSWQKEFVEKELTAQEQMDQRRKEAKEQAENDYFVVYLGLKQNPRDALKARGEEGMNFFQRLLYTHSVLKMDSACDVPEVHGYISHRIRKAYFVAITFMLAASFYIFLFGICGPPEEKSAAEGGGYACLASGQTEELTVHWIHSLIVFSLVAWLVTRPASIFVMNIVLPSAALSALKKGMHRKASVRKESLRKASLLEDATTSDAAANPLHSGSGAGSGIKSGIICTKKKHRTTITYESGQGELQNPMHGSPLNSRMQDGPTDDEKQRGEKSGDRPKQRRSMSQKMRSSMGLKGRDGEEERVKESADQLWALVEQKGLELALERSDIDMLKQSLANELDKLVAGGQAIAAQQTTKELLQLSDEQWKSAAAQFLSEEQIIDRLRRAGFNTEGLEQEDPGLLREMYIQMLEEKAQKESEERARREQLQQEEREREAARVQELQTRAATAIVEARERAQAQRQQAVEAKERAQGLRELVGLGEVETKEPEERQSTEEKAPEKAGEPTSQHPTGSDPSDASEGAAGSSSPHQPEATPKTKFFRVKKGSAGISKIAQINPRTESGEEAVPEIEGELAVQKAPAEFIV
jgi:hypothetical protein